LLIGVSLFVARFPAVYAVAVENDPQAENGPKTIRNATSNEKAVAEKPVELTHSTRLARGHWMETKAILSKTGRIDVKTRTWSANELSGFHGAVIVFLLDEQGNRLYSTVPQVYGVNSKPLAGCHRDDAFFEPLPADVLPRVNALVIEHLYQPERQLLNRLKEAREASKYLAEIVKQGSEVMLIAGGS
jgi:hypothetical protein